MLNFFVRLVERAEELRESVMLHDHDEDWEQKRVLDLLDDAPCAARCFRCHSRTIPCKFFGSPGEFCRATGCAYSHITSGLQCAVKSTQECNLDSSVSCVLRAVSRVKMSP